MAQTTENSNTGWWVKYRHYWIEMLRIYLGCLLFYKGYYFVENISEIGNLIEQTLPVSPFLLAHYVVFAHLIGGLLIIFGLLTRFAVFLQIPILAGAVFFVHGGIFFGTSTDVEYTLLVLILLIVFFFYGSGKLSIDHRLMRKKQNDKNRVSTVSG